MNSIVKTATVPQEKSEIFIAQLKKLGHKISSVTVDEKNFMLLLIKYVPV